MVFFTLLQFILISSLTVDNTLFRNNGRKSNAEINDKSSSKTFLYYCVNTLYLTLWLVFTGIVLI